MSGAFDSIFGGGPDVSPASTGDIIKPFDFGGLSGRISGKSTGNIFSINESPERRALIEALKASFGDQATRFADEIIPAYSNIFDSRLDVINNQLLPQVAPGFGGLTEARLEGIDNARTRLEDRSRAAAGDLKENLNRRNILGSSFANDAQTRRQNEYERYFQELDTAEKEARATSFLEELDITTQFLNDRFKTELAGIETTLQNFNTVFNLQRAPENLELENYNKIAEIGAGIMQSAIPSFGQAYSNYQQQAANAAAGNGDFLSSLFGGDDGGIFGDLAKAGSSISSIFTGSGGQGADGSFGWEDAADIAQMAAQIYMASDARIKEDIVPAGEENGHKLYEFSYKGMPGRRFIGVMAQDVIKKVPEAVTQWMGIMRVNYSKIGVNMVEVSHG